MYIYNMNYDNITLLWGLTKADPEEYKLYLSKNNNPRSVAKTKNKNINNIDSDITFIIGKKYKVEDLTFLEVQLEKIRANLNNICIESTLETDKTKIEKLNIEYENFFDLEDKIIETIEELQNLIEEKLILNEETPKLIEEKQIIIEENPIIEELNNEKRLKEYIKNKEKINYHINKIRYAKGSIEALAQGKLLAEARKRARELQGITTTCKERAQMKRDEKERLKKEREELKVRIYKSKIEKRKPWFYIGIIPPGYREASELEAIKAGKVSSRGQYKIKDRRMYDFYVNFNIQFYDNMPKEKILIALSIIPKLIIKTKNRIEYLENKLENENTAREAIIDELNHSLSKNKNNLLALEKGLEAVNEMVQKYKTT